MKIITTYGELIMLECWEDYCSLFGIDPFCIKRDPEFSGRDTEVHLNFQDATIIGLIGMGDKAWQP